jgi:DNA polymerase-3 subunit beta
MATAEADLGVETEAFEEDTTSNLELSTKKFVLQAILERAAAVLPTRDLVPLLKNFQIEARSDGDVRVVATDLELALVVSTNVVTVNKPGTAVFPGKRLLDICKEASDGELLLAVTNGLAHIAVGRTRWDLKLMDGTEYPELPDTSQVEFHTVKRPGFVSAIRSVAKAASTSSTRPNLMMLDIHNGRMRASDGTRFQQVTLEDWPEGFDIQIPISAVDDLAKLLRETEVDDFEVGEVEGYLVFRVGGDVFLSNKLVVDFPNVDKLLLEPAFENKQKLYVDRDDLTAAIKRVRIAADQNTPAVVLHLEDNTLTVRSRDNKGSTAAETLDVSWDGKTRDVGFNASQLLDMLAMSESQSCNFFLGKDTKSRPSSLLLRDDERGMVGVLNQIRIDWIS